MSSYNQFVNTVIYANPPPPTLQCVGVIVGRLTGSSCESSISAAERPDMSAHTAYSLDLESVSGPCFTQPQEQKTHRHRINGKGGHALCSFLMRDSPLPLSHKRSLMRPSRASIVGAISKEVATMENWGSGLISGTRPAGEGTFGADMAGCPHHNCVNCGIKKACHLTSDLTFIQ